MKLKKDKTIKEEDELQEIIESQMREICLIERNPEQETIKNLQKGSKKNRKSPKSKKIIFSYQQFLFNKEIHLFIKEFHYL